jgi:hypothetical protein
MDTATHCFYASRMETVNFFINQTYPFASLPGSWGLSFFNGAYWTSTFTAPFVLNDPLPASGLSFDVDSIDPGVAQSITIYATRGIGFYTASVYCGGTLLTSSSIGHLIGGVGTVLSFTPTSSLVTVQIEESLSGTHTIELDSVTVQRYDSSAIENVTSLVCNEDHYHYGFNGQLKVNEIAGVGNHNTALFWEYDTRTARRWNPDPVLHAWESPYAVMGGNPIWHNDVLGNEFVNVHTKRKEVAKTKFDEASKNYNERKTAGDASKKELRQLERKLNNAKSDYENEVKYEAVVDKVIKEFQKVNPTEFDKWNNYKPDGTTVLDIKVSAQDDAIQILDKSGFPTGRITDEGINADIRGRKTDYFNIRLQTVPNAKTVEVGVRHQTSVLVHALGHVEYDTDDDSKGPDKYQKEQYEDKLPNKK